MNKTTNQILKQVEGLPTLVDKLRFIEDRFPTDEDTLKQVVQRVQREAVEQELPLFAEHIEIPEVEKLSGIDTYDVIAYQVANVSQYSDFVIRQYAQNPKVSKAIRGYRFSGIFNKDRKPWNWGRSKNHYSELMGDGKPIKSPVPKVSRSIKEIFCKVGVPQIEPEGKFTEEDLKHPIAYLDKKIHKYCRRVENRACRLGLE